AYYVCRELNVNDLTFAKAIADFTGASKRLELLAETAECNVYRDFAHAPSKVIASINAVKQQYPQRKLIAILELHTFSSLNADFMSEYAGTMENADDAIVFYSNHALELKRMPALDPLTVIKGFDKLNLNVITERKDLEKYLKSKDCININFLFMSSGNYEGMNILEVTVNK
ncbi:MAG: glutamate ligase domain-containing protein, partial [Ginsengibacter sp.]